MKRKWGGPRLGEKHLLCRYEGIQPVRKTTHFSDRQRREGGRDHGPFSAGFDGTKSGLHLGQFYIQDHDLHFVLRQGHGLLSPLFRMCIWKP